MMRSMTGFGRSTITSASGKITLEINSTNRRFLEINILMPKTFVFLENDIRKLIENKTLNNILDMKNKEGNALYLDIKSRIEFIKKLISIIQKKAPDAKKAYEKKLKEKLKALISEESFKDKILKEAAIYSEKVDI